MKVVLGLGLFLLGCHQHDQAPIKEPVIPEGLRYKVYDCVYLIDPENGKGKEADALRIDVIDSIHYWYRWYTYGGSLSLDLLNTFGEHKKFERLTRKLDKCPPV